MIHHQEPVLDTQSQPEPAMFMHACRKTLWLLLLICLGPPPQRCEHACPFTPQNTTPQVLTLANGDRILMTPAMKAMFEPENLNNASPATVSRAGIIYVSETELGWQPVVTSWLARRAEPGQAPALQACFDKYVARVLEFVRIHLHPVMHNETICTVNSLLTLLSATLQK